MVGTVAREERGRVVVPLKSTAKRRARAEERRTLLEALLRTRAGDARALETVAKQDVTRISVYARRTLDLPPCYGLEDTRQDVLLALWKSATNWNPTRGVPLVTHALWNAITSSRKRLHEVRNAKGKRDAKEPSRFPRCEASFWSEDEDGERELQARIVGTDGGRGAAIAEAITHYRMLLEELDPEESVIVRILVEEHGGVERTADRIFNEEEPRDLLGIVSFNEARERVRAAAERLLQAA